MDHDVGLSTIFFAGDHALVPHSRPTGAVSRRRSVCYTHTLSLVNEEPTSGVEKMTIALTREMAGFVRDAVNAGEYASTSEAIREAVREWKERRDLLGYTVEELRDLVEEAVSSGPSARPAMSDVKAEARRRLQSGRQKD